jgi:HTH-type transcriptional regulator/antitoxin HigA
MEQKGMAPPDLIPFIGNRNRVEEVLARRRPLTLEMVQRLHAGLGIPAESLIRTGGYKAA